MNSARPHLGRIIATVACLAVVAWASLPAAAQAENDSWIKDFSAGPVNQDGSPSSAAAARPYELFNSFDINQVPSPTEPFHAPQENLKSVKLILPPGNIANAAAYPRCPQSKFPFSCPADTMIGTATLSLQFIDISTVREPVYNLVPPPGMPLQFGFASGSRIHINFKIRNGTDYGATAEIVNVTEAAPLYASMVRIWGDPADPSHDAFRGVPYPDPEAEPLLSNPTQCGVTGVTELELTSWQHVDDWEQGTASETPPMTGCAEVEFEPTIEAKPTTNLADSPSGLDFDLKVPQNNDPDGAAAAHLRTSTVKLPSSLTINASSANGLGACTPQQIGLTSPSNERQFFHFDPYFTQTFELEFEGASTPVLPSEADREEVQAALEALPTIGTGNVELKGAPGGWVVTFIGHFAGTDVPQISATSTSTPHQRLVVTGEGGGYNLQSGGTDTETKFQASVAPGQVFFFPESSSRELKPGQTIEGPGLAPGTRVTGNFGIVIVDKPTIGSSTEGHYRTVVPYNATAEEVQAALEFLPTVGAGNAVVHPAGIDESTRTYLVAFPKGEPTVTTTSNLIGNGPGVSLSVAPVAPEELTVSTVAEAGRPQFTGEPPTCPDASKLGTVKITSEAVVDHPLEGQIYLATPHDNPYDSLLGVYLSVSDAQTGVVLKIPGRIDSDPRTGQLTAVFEDAPQLPFEDLNLEFFKGAAAPLKTGIACGKFKVESDLVPWSAPEGPTMHPADSFEIASGAAKGPCASSEANAPDAPRIEAGTIEPSAGLYSPFVLRIARDDGSQRLTGVDTVLPRGLLARLAGVPYCSDAALAAAAKMTGRAEKASPSCPAASHVGNVNIGAGAGPSPFYTGGDVYLAGPYKGAPLSLAVITPAVAGPFDLGTVVIRNALHVDPTSAQVRAVSDPIPSILEGIPLDLRSIVLRLDRDQFTKNPTSCAPLAFGGSLTALTGQQTPIAVPFQVGDCPELGFKPKLALSVRGGVKRRGHPALRAVLTLPEGQSNIARAAVALPKSELLDNSHIKTVCTRVQFAAQQCPASSVYGFARAVSPLLAAPIEGPVYLRSSSNKLPDLVADLRGQIDIVLAGRIDSAKGGGLRATFEDVPDAPVSQFVLDMQGGAKGLLQNSVNLCGRDSKASAVIDGQTTKTVELTPKVRAVGCKSTEKKKKRNAR